MSRQKFDNILLWIIRIGIYAVFIVPLIFHSGTFFPFIVFKNTLFRIIIEIIFAAFLILAMRNQKYRPKKNGLITLVCIFFIITAITSLIGVNVGRSLWGDYERMGGLFGFAHILGFFIILISVFKKKEDWFSLMTFTLFASVIMSFFALSQKLNAPFMIQSGGGARLTATIGNAIYLAAYMLFHIFFSLYFLIRDKDFDIKLFFWSMIGGDIFLILYDLYLKITYSGNIPGDLITLGVLSQIPKNKYFFAAFLSFHILVLFAYFFKNYKVTIKTFISVILFLEILILAWTQTRGAMLGLIGGLVYIVAYGAIYLRGNSRKFNLVGVGLIMVFLVFLYFGKDIYFIKKIPVLERLSTINFEDVTTQSRILAWSATWKGWTEHPLRFVAGYGLENYFVVFDKHFPTKIFKDSGSQIWFDRAHNIIFDTGVNTGIIGLLVYLMILFFSLRILHYYYKKENDFILSSILSAALVGYFIQNLFVFDTLDSHILFFFILSFVSFLYGLSFAHETWLHSMLDKVKFSFKFNSNSRSVIPIIIILLTCISVYSFNIKLVQSNMSLYSIIRSRYNDPKEYRKNIEGFLSAIKSSITGRYEARYQLSNYATDLFSSEGVDNKDLVYVGDIAIRELEKNIEEDPLNVRQYLHLASLYNRFSKYVPSHSQKSIELMLKARELSPTRPQIFFELGYSYINSGDMDAGFGYLRKGAELAPHAKDGRIVLILTYINFKKFNEAEQEIEATKKYSEVPLNTADFTDIVKAYEKAGYYDTIIKLSKYMIEKEPNNSYYYARMALAYAFLGENQNAEDAIRNANRLDPSRKKETEEFLKALDEGKLRKK